MAAIEHNYDVSVTWSFGRKGYLSSSELDSHVEVATPPEFPKGEAGIWSPEHLFVAAVNSCLMTTFLAIAEDSKLEFASFRSKATGKLEMVDGKYKISEIVLEPCVKIVSSRDEEKAVRVLQKSEANCLISNSITSKIIFKPLVDSDATIVC